MNSLMKMLVVEDNPEMRMALAQQFEAEEFTVDTANDGMPALELIRHNRYDIILLDLSLPRMNGVNLLKELHHLPNFPNVVVLTASNSLLRAVECVKLGAKSYLLKPYDPAELVEVVTRVVNEPRS